CNVANSWIFAAAKLNFELRIAAPKTFQPHVTLKRVATASNASMIYGGGKTAAKGAGWMEWNFRGKGKVTCTNDLKRAARGADLLYTDVWVSMGKEAESAERLKILNGYQLDEKLVKLAKPDVLVMHCLPAYRGKEIDEQTFEAHADTIFTQA